jgi:hypothetical protein
MTRPVKQIIIKARKQINIFHRRLVILKASKMFVKIIGCP